jgi:predicted dehydrogenase
VPIGHPEGFVEAFANIYADAAMCMRGTDASVPDYRDGLAGMQFIDAVLRSEESGQWAEV